uniref:Uncharacterized protein n=1 Tax=Globodera rostochiensis TaxID=31243 RepID=A0A914HC30_GLORO
MPDAVVPYPPKIDQINAVSGICLRLWRSGSRVGTYPDMPEECPEDKLKELEITLPRRNNRYGQRRAMLNSEKGRLR